MFYSLRFGILLAMLAVAVVAITTITIFVGLSTRVEFSRYVEAGRELQQERVQQAILMWANPNLVPAVSDIESLQYLTSGTSINTGNYRFRPLGTFGTLESVDDSFPLSEGDIVRFEIAPDGSATVYEGSDAVGSFFVDPVSEMELLSAQNDFVESVNWTLLITAIVAGLAAIALTVILSRRILHPVAELTLATRHLESGDFRRRVRVHAAGEIGELAHAFNAMAETLDRNEELRRNMVSDIAHELRTPVTNIRGYLEAIQDDMLDPDRTTINLLHEEAMMLNQLIQDLQELALAESGQLRLELQPVDLEMVVAQTISVLRPSITQKQLQIRTTFPDPLPPVQADQRRVAQVLRNLLNNAIIHTPEGGTVNILAEVRPQEVEVRVSDSGEGIDAAHLPFVFERFYRADPSRSRATGGAGLGLAIVKQLVERQDGHVRVESIKGKGASFSFALPRHDLSETTGVEDHSTPRTI